MFCLFCFCSDPCSFLLYFYIILTLFYFREKKQKIQDIKNNIKEAIEVSVYFFTVLFILEPKINYHKTVSPPSSHNDVNRVFSLCL